MVQIRKIVQRRIRGERDGVSLLGDVNAVISANVNEGASKPGQETEPSAATRRNKPVDDNT